ncbi:hypothetical protein [Plebeiibacterium marinum]|uniref:Uncharacterized protein n=1 Tax=Plebeiibacterium marinum TaxID=2992111 RepID=A0AAE3SLD8_9BACT|nr:hypothetical protein [Plebeiobacterium marinum]MCW3807785.1 hypothetical protein [Plebeiobacterium marinum]
MQKYLCVGLFLVFAFVFGESKMEARKFTGYIITNQNDTVNGFIKHFVFNRRTGGFVFNGFDPEWHFIEVAFKESLTDHYDVFKPGQIKEYGFYCRNQLYIFRTKIVIKKSLVTKESHRKHFLQLISSGDGYEVYKHQVYLDRCEWNLTCHHPFYEYYYCRNGERLTRIWGR